MRGYRSKPAPDATITEAALDAMDADGLRTLIREMLPWFDDALQARFANALVDRAARNGSGWVPQGPTDALVKELEACAEAAKRVGYAEPSEVDAYLRDGANAFLAKDYAAAYDEAAELVSNKEYTRGDFLDGAALAAQELGRKDQPARLERAWREAPSMMRLRRWLGSSNNKKVLVGRVGEALADVPKHAHRQRALLHVLGADFGAAAKLLASAKGLGWSSGEHPGHLLFPVFVSLLGGVELPGKPGRDLDELSLLSDLDEPRRATPEVIDLIRLAGVQVPTDPATRAALIRSMRSAAERRIAGVTENKRRRHYGHAASLALACAQVDGSTAGTKWLDGIRDEYRRYPALQRELGGRKGRA